MLYVRHCLANGRAMTTIESRRQAILAAMVQVIGGKGYHEATVADVLSEAGVSRATFYKHFDDKHECFLAAYDRAAERTVTAIASGCAPERAWTERARGSLEALLELFVAEPELARAVIVEPAVAGGDARRRQWAMTARVALMLASARGRVVPALPANTGLMAVGGVAGLLFDEIQAGRVAELGQRLPDLLFALLVPYLGPCQAAEKVQRRVSTPLLRGKATADARRVAARGREAARSRR
jgi:AcrR family transcriptional regulator